MTQTNTGKKRQSISEALNRRILILDGAMGTMIQQLDLDESHYHTPAIKTESELKGCNDILCLSQPDKIIDIHRQYLEAGASIIETNSFNANAISLDDYGIAHLAADINAAAARLARQAVDRSGRQAWVAGSIGPTNKSLSISLGLPDAADAAPVTFDDMEAAYADQIRALIEGGVDLLLVETIFDSLNAKAVISAAEKAMAQLQVKVPMIFSVTLTESGRTLSGQTLEAFIATIAHASPIAVGLNCGFGADGMMPHIETLQRFPFAICVYPNAGLPDVMGQYNETPHDMARKLRIPLENGMLNIVGGCCGTTPRHIEAIARVAAQCAPRPIPAPDDVLTLAGLESVPVDSSRNFMNIGERCNVAGSRKFLRLIKEGDIAQAIDIARSQAQSGAQVIDINMDDAMLNSVEQMNRFLAAIAAEPEVARLPLMIDSSKWDVITEALKRVQGRPIVNSISLKEGPEAFIEKALHIHRMGAAMVVMAFDEHGQADTFQRKTEVCRRAYSLLTQAGIPPQDIIFDPNILAVATGIEQHNRYALDFLNATEWIRRNLPGAKVSGGLSNLSFSFRGNNYVREAMHAIFLFHAIARGMDMAIVNAAALMPLDDIDPSLRRAIDDVLFDSDPGATDRLIDIAEKIKAERSSADNAAPAPSPEAQSTPVEQLENMVVRGIADGLPDAIDRALPSFPSALALIEGPLMTAMNRVGRLFGEGRLFLPQVVKSARTMKLAVSHLTPLIEREKQLGGQSATAGKMVIATVKGDVHDIGKNIVDVIMNCNNFEMIDLGVMVPGEDIVTRAIDENADFIGLSGLITPSLEEMCHVARLMESRGMRIPLMIGGAGTSAMHTAVKIAPCYSGPVVYTRDAAMMPTVAQSFGNPATRPEAESRLRADQQRLREQHSLDTAPLLTLDQARAARMPFNAADKAPAPLRPGIHTITIPVDRAAGFINWRAFFAAWKLDASFASIADVQGCDHCRAQWIAAIPQAQRPKAAEAMQLWKEAQRALDAISHNASVLMARIALVHAGSVVDDIILRHDGQTITIPTIRKQTPDESGHTLSLADFIEPASGSDTLNDWIGLFAVTVGPGIQQLIDRKRQIGDDYQALLYQSIADRLVEAATELLHADVRRTYWGYADDEPCNARNLLRQYYQGIRPAIGYPSLPDQSLVFEADRILRYSEIGISLTENGALSPAASTTGLFISHPASHYFIPGRISPEQRADYATRRGMSPDEAARFLP